jgi:hypothetical protein
MKEQMKRMKEENRIIRDQVREEQEEKETLKQRRKQ